MKGDLEITSGDVAVMAMEEAGRWEPTHRIFNGEMSRTDILRWAFSFGFAAGFMKCQNLTGESHEKTV
jgi:hypothetical protein